MDPMDKKNNKIGTKAYNKITIINATIFFSSLTDIIYE